MSKAVETAKNGRIFVATINRPEKLNAINLDVAEGLSEALRAFAEDDGSRVMLVRANGRYFCAGADINSELFPDPALSGQSKFRRWYGSGPGSIHPLLDTIESLEKPVVVAHQGPCFGGGLEFSLACDFRLAAKAATYALPEIALGGLPGSGGISRLTRIVGPHWARWLVMGCEPMTAERALTIGLVHDVYGDAQFDDRVNAFCERLAAQPPEALAAAKLAIELTADLDRAQGRNVERLAVGSLVMGAEFVEKLAEVRAKLKNKD